MLRRALLAALLGALSLAGAVAATLGVGGASGAVTTSSTAATSTTSTGVTTTTATVPAAGRPAVTLLFSGHGWGHGAGLSQWGARGYAEHGWTYDRILAHYYPGTTLGAAPVTTVRVLLVEGARTLTLSSAGPWRVVDAEGTSADLAAGKVALNQSLKLRPPGEPDALVPPLTFQGSSGPLKLGTATFRGAIAVQKGPSGKLQAIDAVGLEDYLRGVVPSEMPFSWPAEALKAQAVAARSYALAQRATGKEYDLYADTRSQVYLGVAAEKPSTNTAIDATAGRVLLYKGQVATALFSSSSGGRTAAQAEAFAGAKGADYLVSVEDPYDASPYVDWGPVAVDGAKAAQALGLEGPVLDIATTLGPSGRVLSAAVALPAGPAIVTGPQLRFGLGLRSTWLSIGLLSLSPPAAPVSFGRTATLTGVARGAGGVVLEQRSGAGGWLPAPVLKAGANGAFTVKVKPPRTTDYRLAAPTAVAAVARVAVAPVVTLGSGLRGKVRPVVAGRQVVIQQQFGSRWTKAATVPVAAGGAFSGGAPAPGTYRARYAPGAGLVAGVSAPVVVS
jgi:stage II sporulation protein D